MTQRPLSPGGGRRRHAVAVALAMALAVVLATLLPIGCGHEPTNPGRNYPVGTLGFVSGNRNGLDPGIYAIELNGSGLHLLAPGSTPVCSPDRSRIAYDVGYVSDHSIWTVKADGSARTRLAGSVTVVARGSAWSPDGRRIAFYAYPKSAFKDSIERSEIYVMNHDGSGQTKLTSNAKLNRAPAWSPDGRQIAFACMHDSSENVFDEEIYVMNVDGSGLTRLTSPYSPDINPGFNVPKWSPDGRLIACWRQDFGVPHLYVMNADGSGLRRLTDIEPATAPKWSPDGGKILFGSADGHVVVIHADGSELTTIGVGTAPVWSPDGKMIAFIASAGLYVVSADGSDPFRVHQPADSPYVIDGAPFWLR